MEHDHDFSAVQNLLALKKQSVPQDTEVNRFLIEFHRRQRAQLLVRESVGTRLLSWIKARAEGLGLVPSLSYASGFAAIAVMTFFGFSQQVRVSQVDGQYRLSLRSPANDASFAMIPTSFSRGSAQATDNLTFSPTAKSGATRFVLTNSRVAYDATVAF